MSRRTRRSISGLVALLVFSTTVQANDDVIRLAADPGNVVMPSISYNGWNYSPLNQITTDNVGDLRISWYWRGDVADAHQAPPLVVGERMYIASPKPNRIYAFDLASEPGALLWTFIPEMEAEEAALQACCGANTRGLNHADGRLFLSALDGQVFAVDASTGELLWRSVGTDLAIGETMTGNMIVVGGLLIAGSSGGDRGVRGKVQAFDINTGERRWVMYSMGPDDEVGIGAGYRAFYPDNRDSLSTWYGDSWRRGGGAVWGYFTYDPGLRLFYYSTGNCGPWNPDYRRQWGVVTLDANGGLEDYRNNWCASQLARDAVTGELAWAFNMTPADMWDYDEPGITPLIDREIDGVERQLAIKAARNGFLYIWNRATGELLAEPWMHSYVNWATGYDMVTGRARMNIDAWLFTDLTDRRRYTEADAGTLADGARVEGYAGIEAYVCPAPFARSWQNDAYSPQTGLLYAATAARCTIQARVEGEYVAGEGYFLRRAATGLVNVNPDRDSPTFGEVIAGGEPGTGGYLSAYDPIAGTTTWRRGWTLPNMAPVLATAGGLVFQMGNDTGNVRAISAETGDTLWEFRLGDRGQSSPISYLTTDGRQRIAVMTSSPAPVVTTPMGTPGVDWVTRYRRIGTGLYVFSLQPTTP